MTLLPERCTDKVNVYHVSFANNDYASRMYGILCVPKAFGEYPAILKVPGAGIRAYNGEAERAGKGVHHIGNRYSRHSGQYGGGCVSPAL